MPSPQFLLVAGRGREGRDLSTNQQNLLLDSSLRLYSARTWLIASGNECASRGLTWLVSCAKV